MQTLTKKCPKKSKKYLLKFLNPLTVNEARFWHRNLILLDPKEGTYRAAPRPMFPCVTFYTLQNNVISMTVYVLYTFCES